LFFPGTYHSNEKNDQNKRDINTLQNKQKIREFVSHSLQEILTGFLGGVGNWKDTREKLEST
jgi:hypothetical protein